jgi:iron complex transport system ATP-binding protein
MNKLLQINKVSGGYGKSSIVKNVSLSVNKQEFVGIIGPNGCGKTTLLKLISKTLPLHTGEVLLNGFNMTSMRRKKIAQELAVLPQINELNFSMNVKEVVSLGRYPYQSGVFPMWTKNDENIVKEVMKATAVLPLANKGFHTLSGGEKQRVLLARSFAQEPNVLLLDEPANHLDIAHQMQLFSLIRSFILNEKAVIAVFHDLNMASLFCDRIIVMNEGEIVKEMLPENGLDYDCLSDIYKVPFLALDHPTVNKKLLTIDPL